MKKLILLFVVLPFMTSPLAAVADELDTPAVAKPGEMIVEVNGVVCSICAKGLKKNLAKLNKQQTLVAFISYLNRGCECCGTRRRHRGPATGCAPLAIVQSPAIWHIYSPKQEL